MALLIIFEVKNEKRRKCLVEAIEHHGEYIKLADSGYAIKTDATPGSVYNALHRHVGSEDRLLVLPLTKPYTSGNAQVQQWLDKNLSD